VEQIVSQGPSRFKKGSTSLDSQGIEAQYILQDDKSELDSVKCLGRTNAQVDKVKIESEDIFLRYAEQKLKVVELPHHPVIHTEKKEAHADSALYYPEEEKAVLIGHALLVTENSRVEGAKVTFFVNEDRILVEKVLGRRTKE